MGMRFYIAAGIYVGLTVLKLAVPELAVDVKNTLFSAINNEYDYVGAIYDLGESLGSNDYLIKVLGRGEDRVVETNAPNEPYAPSNLFRPENLTETRMRLRGYVERPSRPEPDSDGGSAPEIADSDITKPQADDQTQAQQEQPPVEETYTQTEPEYVSVFLESQAEFADYQIPEDVSYGYMEIPFEYVSPIAGYSSSGFGYRLHPVSDTIKFHYGTDVAANSGQTISAFADGYVRSCGYEEEGYGYYVIITHADGWETLYAHCSGILTSEGSYVSAGDSIALVGETGVATGPHLHFELISNGVYLNPEYYINEL